MSSITKDQLLFDPAGSDNDNIGAYVRSSDGTLIDHETINSVERLAVDATLKDGAGNALSSTGGALHITDGGTPIEVEATDLDIRDLVNTQDSVAIGDETNIIDLQALDSAFGTTAQTFPISGVRRDADTSPVDADGDAHPLVFDDEGQLKVRASVVATVEPSDAEFLEDSAHSSGDAGLQILAVRQDTLSSLVDTDGDYASLKVDSVGRLWTAASISGDVADDAADSGNPIKIGSRATDAALSALSAADDRADVISDLYRRIMVNSSAAIAVQSSQAAVTDSAAQLMASPLAGRRKVVIQNIGNAEVFIGHSGVTSGNGLELRRRTSIELEIGEHVDLYAVCTATESSTLRLLEQA